MTSYATKECHDCSLVLPANEMVRRSGTAVTGTTQSTTYARDRVGGVSTTTPVHSSATHTAKFSYFLCPECAERRRREIRRLILFVVFIGIPVALFAAMFFLQPSPQGPSVPGTPSQYPDSVPANDANIGAIEEQIPQPDEEPSEEATLQATPQLDILAAAAPPRSDQLNGAVAAALDTGNPTVIKIGGQSWSVQVSEPVETSTATCRNVSIGDQQSTWCRSGESDWTLAR